MSLKQFPSRGAFSGYKEDGSDNPERSRDQARAQSSKTKERETVKHLDRQTAQVFDVEQAWEMLEKKRAEIGEEVAPIEGLAALGRLDAARIAAAAGVKVDANFTIAQAVDTFRRIKFREIQLYILFLVLFILGHSLRADRQRANILFGTMQEAFMDIRFLASDKQYKRFDDIASIEDFWAYTKEGMPQFLFKNNDYDPASFNPSFGVGSATDLLWIMRYNVLIQPIRIRQVRSLPAPLAECGIAIRLINDNIECWPRYDPALEDTSPIPGWPAGTSLEYKSEVDLLTSPFGRTTRRTYGGGGFVLDVPRQSSEAEYRAMFDHLRTNGWSSKGTRVIFYDVCMYNPSLRFYISVRLAFEFQPYGSVLPSKSFRVFKGPSLSGDAWDVAGFYLEQVVYLGVLGLLAWDGVKLRQMGARYHFANAWNVLALANYAIFFVSYSASLNYLGSDLFSFMSADAPEGGPAQAAVFDLDAVGAQYNLLQCLTGVNALLSWVKLLEYTKYWHLGAAQMLSTTGKCAADCGVWLLMCAIILFAYAQAFYLAFGPDVAGFNSFGEALTTMTVWAFDVVDLSSVLSSDQVLASVLFVSFQVVFTVVLINMFIVTLMRSYADAAASKHAAVDPIASEVRKSVRVRARRFLERLVRLLPAAEPDDDDDDDDDGRRDGAGEGEGAKAAGAQLGRERGGVGAEEVRVVLAEVQTVHLEVKFLAERVAECAKMQGALTRGLQRHVDHHRRGTLADAHRDHHGRFQLNLNPAPHPLHQSGLSVSGQGFGGWGGDSAASSARGARGPQGPVDLLAYRGLEMAWLPARKVTGGEREREAVEEASADCGGAAARVREAGPEGLGRAPRRVGWAMEAEATPRLKAGPGRGCAEDETF